MTTPALSNIDVSQPVGSTPSITNIDLTGITSFTGVISSDLSFSAALSGSVGSKGVVSSELGFSASLSGTVTPYFGAISSELNFAPRFIGFQDWTALIPVQPLQEIYRLIVTGSQDGVSDLSIGGISSWQATNQADGRSSYLQAVIPAADGALDELAARENGELVIQKGYRFEDGSERYEEILRSRFDTFRWDRGPRAFTATISGYLAGKQLQSSKRTLTGVRSLSMTNGKHRTRCDIDLFLQPGMLVVASDVTFKAGYINYYVNQTDKFCEVGER